MENPFEGRLGWEPEVIMEAVQRVPVKKPCV